MQKHSRTQPALTSIGFVMTALVLLVVPAPSVSAAIPPNNDPNRLESGSYLDTSDGQTYKNYDALTGIWTGPFPAGSGGDCLYVGDWQSGAHYAGYGACISVNVPTRENTKGFVVRVDVQVLQQKSVSWHVCVEEAHGAIEHDHCNDDTAPPREGACMGIIAATVCRWDAKDLSVDADVTYLCAYGKLWIDGIFYSGAVDCADISGLPA